MTIALVVLGLVLVAALGAVLLKAYLEVRPSHRFDSAVHEVGHALLLCIQRGHRDANIRIVADRAGVPSAVRHDFSDGFLDSPRARPWLMLVCLAGHAAEAVAGSELNREAGYREGLHRITAAASAGSDAAKWESLARLDVSAGQSPIIPSRRDADFAALVAFFNVNERVLVEAANELLTKGGAMSPEELQPFVARIHLTDGILRVVV